MMHRLDLDETQFQIVRGLVNIHDDEDLEECIDVDAQSLDRAIALESLKKMLNPPQPRFARLE